LAPQDATKVTHKAVRDRCKAVVLGTLYGMGEETLARRIGVPTCEACELLRLHRATYPRFWAWSQGMVDSAVLTGRIQTVFGWPLHIGAEFKARSLMNFPMQANGAEMLRLACCLATERGILVCASVHDAILIEASAESIDEHVAALQACMREASRIVLGGVLELGSDRQGGALAGALYGRARGGHVGYGQASAGDGDRAPSSNLKPQSLRAPCA
jgi:DNA polymerase I